MADTHYSYLVNEAMARRKNNTQITKTLRESLVMDSIQDSRRHLEALALDIKMVNDHIKVDESIFGEASVDYDKIANKLVEKLHWPNESIRIIPQGSVSTKTLIRSPDNSKFDIDAVCSVDLSMIEVNDPMDFFDKVGLAIEEWEPEAKRRCWKVDFKGRRYYIEFTPSTPLNKVPQTATNQIALSPSNRYRDKALAVVNTPSRQWKTSNPEGFSSWVNDQSSRPLLRWLGFYPDFADTSKKPDNGQKECLCQREENTVPSSNMVLLNKPGSPVLAVLRLLKNWALPQIC